MSFSFINQLAVIYQHLKLTAVIIFKSVTERKGRCKCETKLDGKVALVTGGNSGIGLETAKDLARRGATVIIASRDVEKSKAAVEDIVKTTWNPNVHFKTLNLLKFSSIVEFADEFNKTFDRLDILVNNSGCAIGRQKLSEDGIERTTQVNYVGPFLLTNLLLDKLLASKPSRIVIVSSKANEVGQINPKDIAGVKLLGPWMRYANTKLLNILWTRALAKRLPEGVTANALHPGVVKTEIFKYLPERSRKIVLWLITKFFKTREEGAQTTIHLCVAPELEKVSGEYFEECRVSAANKVTGNEKFVDVIWKNTTELIDKRLPKPL